MTGFQRAQSPPTTEADAQVTVSYAWIGWLTVALGWLLGGTIGIGACVVVGPGPAFATVACSLLIGTVVLFVVQRRNR